ncbi:MAG: hypothetical protein H7222_09865 [Methylotenera sp.]|nr:hypothetical protein [Oligoflexia bacterium]
MNKRILALCLLVSMIAGSNAFASRARQSVMGTGDAGLILQDGSFFYDHAYNIFYNPAYVNDFKNWAIIEKSNGNTRGAQGGFVTSLTNFNLGVFMNRASSQTGGTNAVNSLNAYNFDSSQTRPIDVIIGGDMGVKWGLGATYNNSSANGGFNDLVLRAGIVYMDLEPFVNYKIKGAQKVTGAADRTTKDFTIGTKYRMGEFTPYAAFRQLKANTLTNNEKDTIIGGGIGRNTKLAEGARLVYALSYFHSKFSGNFASTRNVIPVDVAIEGDAATWLTLRAGIRYKLMNKTSGTGTQTDDTTGRVGATVHANKVDVDWAFGSSNSAAGSAGTENIDSPAIGFDSGTFSEIALSYKW